jgi:DNA-binding MarR family transcriptional regulator
VRPDLFAPWQEEPERLRARTVGREQELQWLVSTAEAALAGKRPLSCLLVGDRGSGKSHLLALARATLSQPEAICWVGEQTPLSADAGALWARIWRAEEGWGCLRAVESNLRRLLFVDGLDRLLEALGPQERWSFRHHLQERGTWLAGTAHEAALAAKSDEAFFGQLDTWALDPLSEPDSERLFAKVSGEDGQPCSGARQSRRQALLLLAAGNPRAVTVLADTVAGPEGEGCDAAGALGSALQRMAPHYQSRFAALPPLGQQICEVLAREPRALLAGEVQRQIGASSAAVSGAARGLEALGLLQRTPDEQDARASRYALKEPLFRAWLESSRCLAGREARIAVAVGLLADVLLRSFPSLELASAALARSLQRLERALGEDGPPSGQDPGSGEGARGKEELQQLLLEAHLRRDRTLFEAVARAMASSDSTLPPCCRPELSAPAPDALASLWGRSRDVARTWGASCAVMSAAHARAFVDALDGLVEVTRTLRGAEVAALLALRSAAPERAFALWQALGLHPSAIYAQGLWRELHARQHGPLHVELAPLWKLLVPSLSHRGGLPMTFMTQYRESSGGRAEHETEWVLEVSDPSGVLGTVRMKKVRTTREFPSGEVSDISEETYDISKQELAEFIEKRGKRVISSG